MATNGRDFLSCMALAVTRAYATDPVAASASGGAGSDSIAAEQSDSSMCVYTPKVNRMSE
jgi:hypothetical protein